MTINQSFILQNTCIHESVSYLQWILFQLQTEPLLYSPYLWTISGNILCTPWNKYNSLHTVTAHAINLLDISLSNLDQTDYYLFSIDHYQKLINSIKKKIFSMMVLKLCEQSLRVFFCPFHNWTYLLFLLSISLLRYFRQIWFESDIGMRYHLTVLSAKTVDSKY